MKANKDFIGGGIIGLLHSFILTSIWVGGQRQNMLDEVYTYNSCLGARPIINCYR